MRNFLLGLGVLLFAFVASWQFGLIDLSEVEDWFDGASYFYDYDYDYDYDEDYTEDFVPGTVVEMRDENGNYVLSSDKHEVVDAVYDDTDAMFLEKLSGIEVPYEISYDNISWVPSADDYNEDAEIEIDHNYWDLYGMVIAEADEYDLQEYRDIIVDNYANVGNAEILYEGTREVNGKQINEMITNLDFGDYIYQYHLYYYTGPEGSIQFVVYYEDYVFDIYNEDVSKMLNSLVIL